MSWAKPIIALDADGVLLDYHAAYRQVWKQAFGVLPDLRDPEAYWPWDRWNVSQLSLERQMILKAAMDAQFWSSIPALPGVKDACLQLTSAGYELVCVSALDRQFEACRESNILALGLPIARVIATSVADADQNPKAQAIADLKPKFFVDDFAPYFRGISSDVHCALILREPNGSPNVGELLGLAQSRHSDLPGFLMWLESHCRSA